jgi:PAS domain S-box-containing protein
MKKINSKFQLNEILLILLVSCNGFIIFFTALQLQKVEHHQNTAELLIEDILQLKLLTDEYQLFWSKRVERQWNIQHKYISQRLNQVILNVPDTSLLPTLQLLLQRHQQLQFSFYQIGDHIEKKKVLASTQATKTGLMERLNGQLLVQSQMFLGTAKKLIYIYRNKVEQLQKRERIFLFGITLIAVLLVMLNSLFLRRSMLRPLAILQKGSKILGKGDLTYRFNMDRGDEIGDLSRAFDQMTIQLSKITVSKAYVDNIIRSMVDTLIVVNAEGKIRTVNSTIITLLGYTEKELIGKSVTTLVEHFVHVEQETAELQDPESLITLGAVQKETHYIAKNGQKIPMMFSGSVMKDEQDKVQGLVFIAQNITEQKRLQAQLIQSSKLASMGEMATGIAHEINQPLHIIGTIIGTHVELLKRNRESEINASNLMTISKQVKRAGIITARMRTFGRDSFDAAFEKHDLRSLITEVLELYKPLITNDQLKVKTCFNEVPSILCNNILIEQVLINLLTNARDAMQDQPSNEITITTAHIAKQAIIEFKDTGVGIPAEKIARIFDPFFSSKEVGKGTGLGLSISYGIIKQHGGTIKVKETSSKGTTILVEIPV